MASFGIGSPLTLSRTPKLSKYTTRPLRATRATAPGILPASISDCRAWLTRWSRSDESPTSSGLAVGRPCAHSGPVRKRKVSRDRRATDRFIAHPPGKATKSRSDTMPGAARLSNGRGHRGEALGQAGLDRGHFGHRPESLELAEAVRDVPHDSPPLGRTPAECGERLLALNRVLDHVSYEAMEAEPHVDVAA